MTMNSSIDTSQWKEFEIGQLFTFDNPPKKFNANNVVVKDECGDGFYPYVVRTGVNNGIKGYIAEDPEYLNAANTISFGQDTATMFYQQVAYFTGDKIKIMTPVDFSMTPNIAHFLLTCMQKSFSNYSWGTTSFKQSQLEKEKITLPVDANGEPDWQYMENAAEAYKKQYIANENKRVDDEYKRKQALAKVSSTTISDDEKAFIAENKATALYRIGDLFKQVLTPSSGYKGKGRKTDQVQDERTAEYSIPLTCAKKGNNGTLHYGKPEDFKSLSNIITVVYDGAVAAGLVYYQPDPVGVFTHSYFIDLKEHFLTENLGLYLAAVIQNKTYPKYSRDNAATWNNKVENDDISLPIKDGVDSEQATVADIDWDYMERYIDILKRKKIEQSYQERKAQLKEMANI